ncbi:Isochorismatase hydrolase [Acrodontium crateriforme]|uniref:Isochorismatase hydrolase n=1 Tax=Acrodontium crateriforme TaxID=150365 RepID=A0AAQ3M8T3_9PEZI|nr:Isochorismatase hydrolase [Acrodontium crateriforme]
MSTSTSSEPHTGTIGHGTNAWHYSSKTGFDLTRPSNPQTGPMKPNLTIQTTTKPITINPSKSALIIIDMQNFFLSPAFGRPPGPGHRAVDQLTQHAIPAARKAGVRIVWLNWGLSDQDLVALPPGVRRAFGFVLDTGEARDKHGGLARLEGLGAECGIVKEPRSGRKIDAGRLLVRDAWNSALYPPLDGFFEEGSKLPNRPDVWMHKNRMSGMWGPKTECEEFLEEQGIKTLFFAGVNTDQCVGGTLMDSFSKGYDCILLSDGCGTSSPEFAQQCFQFNAENTFGFQTTCEDLAQGVSTM